MYSTGARIAVAVIEVRKICVSYIIEYGFYDIYVFFYQNFVIVESGIASE